jgi:hypothetical protein
VKVTYLVHSTYAIFVPEATKDGKIVNPAVDIYDTCEAFFLHDVFGRSEKRSKNDIKISNKIHGRATA